MRNNEGVHRAVNAVVYYSDTGECKRIAQHLAQRLNYSLEDIADAGQEYGDAVLIFPVHCQNIPQTVTRFLRNLKVSNLTVIAAYGKMCHGNVLYEIARRYNHNIVAGAYVPAKHTYIDEPRFCNFDGLEPIVEKVQNPRAVKIPKSYKNPFANFFKGLRSRMGVKIIKGGNCDGCGACRACCPRLAIEDGKTDRKCIRCLRCVALCPKQALTIKLSPLMSAYLKKKKQDELVIYV